MKLYDLSIHALRRLLDQGETTAEEVTGAIYERIRVVEPKVAAYLTLGEERAMEEARSWDKKGYGDTTNNFVSLARFVDEPSSNILSVDIPVFRGDVIGILGATGTTTIHTSYGQNNFVSHIGGHSVTLKRLGMWYNLYENPAQDLYHSSNELGRVEMWYLAD